MDAAHVRDVDFGALALLAKAKSKQQVDAIAREVFNRRKDAKKLESLSVDLAKALMPDALEGKHAERALAASHTLATSLARFIHHVVFFNLSPGATAALFPADFAPAPLRDLLVAIVSAHLLEWRALSVVQGVSLDRLVAFDWRLDVKSGSNHIAAMSVPTLVLQLRIRNASSSVAAPRITRRRAELGGGELDVDVDNAADDDTRVETLELDAATLETLLDGMRKIRAQLDSVKT